MSVLKHDLGMFEGYSFATQGPIFPHHSAQEVIDWDHLADAVEFWPCGDHEGVALVFYRQTAVTAAELIKLDHLLTAIGNDAIETYARIYWLMSVDGYALDELTTEMVTDLDVYCFIGDPLADLSQDAALALFENLYPEPYAIWLQDSPGRPFDPEAFWSTWTVHEIALLSCNILMARAW
ncbi:hypothetical protein [Candidatus Entotheonella palauensis]|uniref:Uncharacterized protein n=1 Tax=Candidatus Entotheonella gemina TaxID=1429439 RepID=W4M2S7_9BACT|nr:hypothetical protein [Candidatus Entotheonella palauensis]ETX04468.1 MAG: hypothetical protein ETSY2_28640 [Candidatus Entotheonella gemina]